MGVKIKEIPKGSDKFWLVIHHKGRRKKKYCGIGKEGKKIAKEASQRISTLLKLPDANLKKLFEDKEKIITFQNMYKNCFLL